MAQITVGELRAALGRRLTQAEAAALVGRVRERIGDEALANGTGVLVDGLDVGWAVEAPAARGEPAVIPELGAVAAVPLRRVGGSGVFAGAAAWPEGTASRWTMELDGQQIGAGQTETYADPPR